MSDIKHPRQYTNSELRRLLTHERLELKQTLSQLKYEVRQRVAQIERIERRLIDVEESEHFLDYPAVAAALNTVRRELSVLGSGGE
jgi:hypothetical protein